MLHMLPYSFTVFIPFPSAYLKSRSIKNTDTYQTYKSLLLALSGSLKNGDIQVHTNSLLFVQTSKLLLNKVFKAVFRTQAPRSFTKLFDMSAGLHMYGLNSPISLQCFGLYLTVSS